jgi:acetolactate synthase-1/2/3 large subunit
MWATIEARPLRRELRMRERTVAIHPPGVTQKNVGESLMVSGYKAPESVTSLDQPAQSPPRLDIAERRRVVIVDDDVTHLRALGRVLKRYRDQLEVSLVDSGIDALIRIATSRADLVVMDVHMPGLDGIQACRRLKANPETADIRVILASSAMTPELEAQALAAGAARAVAKPFDLGAILAEVRHEAPAPRALAVGTLPPYARADHGPEKRRAADVLVDMLAAAGVDTVFGLPGGVISPVHDALLDSNMRVVTTRHESGAMFAAAGYAHTTGKLGVVAVTSGPGALNAMTGLASAWCDGLPLLLLIGEVPRKSHGKGVLQDGSAYGLNIIGMASHISKLAIEVPSPDQLPHLMRRAITTALSGRRGPVVLTLPMDVTTAQIAPPRIDGSVHVESHVPLGVLDDVVRLIDQGLRPLILAGSGVRGPDAPAHLLDAAEALQCPVVTTPKGKGVFPENHPLSLGVFGLGGHASARAYVEAGIDVVVAIGTSLGDLSTDGFTSHLNATRGFVHVDIDARQIGKSYAPTHAIVGDAGDFLAGLAARARASLRAVRQDPAGTIIRQALPSSETTDRIAPQDALAEIQELLPADTIFTADSGDHFLFATHFLEIRHPDSFVVMTGLGSMGQSIGAALGAQLAHRDRTVAVIVGDGCFAMNAFEVATAVQEGMPLRIFVFNDERLGMVENGHQSVYGRKPDYPTGPLDVCMIARGLGAATFTCSQPGDLRAHADLLRRHRGPVVVDVRIDPQIRLAKKDRVGAFAPKPGKSGN